MKVEEIRDEYEWMFRGSCRSVNPGGFFPSDGLGVELAQRVCAKCPVKTECLEYALLYRLEYGVWGGESERERRRILFLRRQDVVAASR